MLRILKHLSITIISRNQISSTKAYLPINSQMKRTKFASWSNASNLMKSSFLRQWRNPLTKNWNISSAQNKKLMMIYAITSCLEVSAEVPYTS